MKCKYLKLTIIEDQSGKKSYVNCCSRKWSASETVNTDRFKNSVGIIFTKCSLDACPYREE